MSKTDQQKSSLVPSEELRASMKFLESVFDRIPGMIYVHDLVNDVNLYRSWTLKRFLGHEESNILNSGKGIRGLVHVDDLPEFKRAAAELQKAEDNECVRFSYRMRHRNGNWLWFRSEEYVYDRDEKGNPIKCLGYATDLTGTIEKQKFLNELNELNEFLLKTARILAQPDTEPTEALQELAQELSIHFNAVCDISVLDEESGVIQPEALYHPDESVRKIILDLFATTKVKKGEGLVGKVIETGEELWIKEVPEVMVKGPVDIDERIVPVSLIYVPIKGSRSTLGSLNLTRLVGNEQFSEMEIERIRGLGEYLSIFVENVLLKQQQKALEDIRTLAEKRVAEEKRWAEFKLELSTLLADVESDLSDVLQQLCERITDFFDVVSDIQLVNGDTNRIELVSIHHHDKRVKAALEDRLVKRELEIGEGMVGSVVKTGKEFFVSQLPADLEKKTIEAGVSPLIIPCSFAYLPLRSHGKNLGTLDLTRLSHQNPISEDELVRMRDLAEHAARFIENRLLQAAQKKEIELRKRAEDKLERNSQLLQKMEADTRYMLNSIPIYIARVSKDLRYKFLNDFYRTMNVDPRKMEGKSIVEVLSAAQVDKLRPRFEEVLSGKLVNYEYEGVLADGERHYFNVALAPDYAENGEVVGFFSCSIDVTSKVLAEKASQITQERFESLSLNSGDAFFFHDDQQMILDVNQVACEMLGYTREEFLKMQAADIDPRWKGGSYLEFLKRLEVNNPQTFDTTVLRKDGSQIPVEVRFVKRKEGKRTYIQSLLRDRTEKREQELKLQQSENQLRLIFDNVEDFIATISEDGVVESVNKTAQGVRREDVIGGSVYDWYPDKETRAKVIDGFELLRTTGKDFEVETTTFSGPDGSTRTYFNKYVAKFQDGKFYKAILIIRDVTVERDREKSVMNAVLKGQEQERKRLGAELHDGIGQVLSAIALQVSQINEAVASQKTERVEEDLTDLNRNLQAAIKEVRNISHDLMPDVLEGLGLKEALKQTCSNLQDRTGITVSFNHVDLEPRYDQAVEVNLFRITQELLNNVQKHANSKKVFVSLMDHGDVLNLTVEDDGIGFDRDNVSGGIGLRNVTSRVNMINGVIDVESAENSGTLINIEVPKSLE